jgi:hypothetical protein
LENVQIFEYFSFVNILPLQHVFHTFQKFKIENNADGVWKSPVST